MTSEVIAAPRLPWQILRMTTAEDRSAPSLDSALRAMAVGRIALGVGSLAAPGLLAKSFGVAPAGEVSYLTRVYGARAIALGVSYLTADDQHRTRLQRLSLGVDATDTVSGLGHLLRRDVPLRGIGPLTGLTGAYAALGAARLLADLRRERSDS